MAFVFVSILLVCFGELEVILCSSVFGSVCDTVLALLWGKFQCSMGQRFTQELQFMHAGLHVLVV